MRFRLEQRFSAPVEVVEAAFLDPAGAGSFRVVEGDLRVRFPLVGAKVERAIVAGLHDHGAAEGRVVQARLGR